jgi:uncharacterized repeat protein (TIGR01451 family)
MDRDQTGTHAWPSEGSAGRRGQGSSGRGLRQRHQALARAVRVLPPLALLLGVVFGSASTPASARRAARTSAPFQSHERTNAVLSADCNQISVLYRGFPPLPGNAVTEVVSIESQHLLTRTFTFDGETATDTFAFTAPGRTSAYHIDVRGKWNGNGFRGGYDLPIRVLCPPAPAFTVQKLQSLAGSSAAPTSETIAASVGQTVDYRFIETNTGNVPLTFGQFLDPFCDTGTVTRSTQEAVSPGEAMSYECTHLLTVADGVAGTLANTAAVTGTPPGETGAAPVRHESNTVLVSPISGSLDNGPEEQPPSGTPANGPEQQPPTGHGEVLTSKTTSSGGEPKTGTTTTGRSGVLGFSSAGVPALKGPQGCVRGPFHVGVKSAGVSSVSFSLDGHRLKTLTSSSSHGGLLSILIDPSRLKVGAHRIQAGIVMKASSSSATAKAARATRSLTVVRCASADVTPHFTG